MAYSGWMLPNASVAMCALDPIILYELSMINQIIRDETWLEAERRGYCVPADDRIVRDNVCGVVLRIGQQLRESARRARASECC